jgi:rod shape determining protein RodA
MRLKDITAIDIPLFLATVALITFGVLFIYSSGISSTGELISNEYIRQTVWGGGGLIIALLLSLFDYRKFYNITIYIYTITLVLLIYTCINGRVVNGARSWIGFYGFGIQPSEFAKISTILFLSQYLDNTKKSVNSIKRFTVSCIIVFIPMVIILLQPDFGTCLVFLPILISVTFIAGLPFQYVLFLFLAIIGSAVLMVLPLWQEYILKKSFLIISLLKNTNFIMAFCFFLLLIFIFSFVCYRFFRKNYFYIICFLTLILLICTSLSFVAGKILKDYQIMRLIVFLDPGIDPRGAGWNINQSITAIGSGGLLGKGFLLGTQSHYRFVPQQSTDFIFSIFAEESGFFGGVIVFALFMFLNFRIIRIAKNSSDAFGTFIATGVSSIYLFHFVVNIGMAMGIMPITGIPLLFMSYGGSSLLSAMIGIGLISSIHVRRYQH